MKLIGFSILATLAIFTPPTEATFGLLFPKPCLPASAPAPVSPPIVTYTYASASASAYICPEAVAYQNPHTPLLYYHLLTMNTTLMSIRDPVMVAEELLREGRLALGVERPTVAKYEFARSLEEERLAMVDEITEMQGEGLEEMWVDVIKGEIKGYLHVPPNQL